MVSKMENFIVYLSVLYYYFDYQANINGKKITQEGYHKNICCRDIIMAVPLDVNWCECLILDLTSHLDYCK